MNANDSPDKRSQVLEAARQMLQTRGFNAFSHRDLAQAVGIKSSSVHYYFPSKADLGVALVQEYKSQMLALLRDIETLATPRKRLLKFLEIFETTAAQGDQLCLAGMLASDFETLGPLLQAELQGFFALMESWLAAQAKLSQPQRSKARCETLGRLAFALLEGALLCARVAGEPQRVQLAGQQILWMLEHSEH